MTHVGVVLDKELAQPPVAVKGRAIEVKVLTQRLDAFAIGKEESNGTDIAVIRAPLDKRHAIGVRSIGGKTSGSALEHQVGPSVGDSVKNCGAYAS